MAKPTGTSHFAYEYLEKEDSTHSNVYNIFYNSCTSDDYLEFDVIDGICEKYEIKETYEEEYVKEFLKKLQHNLNKICSTVNMSANGYFKKTPNNVKEYCIYFKHWLYDEILSNESYILNIDKIFKEWENQTNNGDYKHFRELCTYNTLTLDEIKQLTSIYAFKLIFYDNINIFNTEKNKPCRYLSDLGKGLKTYSESISRCSIENNEDKFCKELKEFQNIYNLDKLYLKTTESSDYKLVEEETINCPLVIESLKEPLLLMYKEGINRWYLSDEPIHFLSTSVISASSAIGTTVGISAFVFYLYKNTNIGSLFIHGKQKKNTKFLNVDEERHVLAFPISESEHTNFGNSEYKILYYSSDNS
ncbi:PIR protein [Plasmodium ovale]|uniref:PIR protein n=1 Tax=Plasmodium ovale TaxID=36330 RepID=A0A1D3JFV6_PLAOA|nr:PIR protein [Plasmodium ovale]